jgi:small GTP-binding protein
VENERAPKLKICLVGDGGVGKTSLIRKYVFDQFSDEYIVTLGTKVTKKDLTISHTTNGPVNVRLLIWDIIGQQGFHQLLKDAYFSGTQGIIGTCDITRSNTFTGLETWVDTSQGVTGEVPMIFLGNKCDLDDDSEVEIEKIKDFASQFENCEAYLSSAKVGVNVEKAFQHISEMILKNMD